MSRMTKIKKISTAWFVVLSFVLQLVYPLAPVEVQAAEIRPEDRIELGNPNNPVIEPKGWASKPNRRADNIYKQAKAMGYGDLRYIEKDITKIYEFYHPWNTERAKQLGTNEYDHDTVNTKDTNTSWTGLGSGYVRRTEIVPMGDVPKSKITKRYVMDDGTFVPPTEAAKTIYLEKRPYISELPRPTFIFKEPNYNNPSRINLNSVTAQYVPKKGQGEAAVYHEENQYRSPYLYYCINVNSYDASRIGGGYFLQTGKYSAQSNFRDIPEIPFILMEIGKELGIKNMNALDEPAARASMARASDLWYAEYEHIYKATGAELNQPSKYIPELTNGEIQAMLYRVLTLHGKEEVINGKTFRVQTDRDTSHPDALKTLIPKEGTSEDDKSSSFVMGIEYPFNYYVMGMPIDAVDILETPGAPLFNRTYANKYLSRALIRLFVAYTEAAREKGLLDKHLMRSDLEAEIVRKQKQEGKTELTIRLTNVKGAKKIEAIIPNELTLVEPANCQYREGTHTEANKKIYTLPVEANVKNTYDLKVSFDKNQINDGNKQLDFAVYKRQNVIGRVWAPKGCYKFDKESGHWLVLEYVHFESWETMTEGFVHGQQLVSFTEQEEDVRTSVRFDVTSEPKPSLSTTVVVDDGRLEGTDTKPAAIEGYVTQPVKVKDKISYKNLVCDATYEVETTLNKIDANDIPVPVSGPTITYQKTTADSPEGIWEVDLGVHNLEPGEKYVVFEKATLKKIGNQDVDTMGPDEVDEELLKPLEHKNPNDLAQTVAVVVPKGDMRTTVIANGQNHEAGKVAIVSGTSIKVTDTIDYKGLVPNETYTLTGTLMEIQGPTITPIATKTVTRAAITSDGRWELEFNENDTTNLKPGVKYVVYEEAVSDNKYLILENDKLVYKKHTVTHQDPNDVSQTLVNELEYSGKIMTTVSTDTQSAVLDENDPEKSEPLRLKDETVEAGVPVKDTVQYKDLLPNTEYTMHGRLMHVLEGSVEVVKHANGSPVESEVRFTTDESGTGSVVIEFGVVKTLENGEKYVVFEKAESEYEFGFINKETNEVEWKKHTVSHEDPNDSAQTIRAGKQTGRIRTTVEVNDVKATFDKRVIVPLASAIDGVRVQDHVSYEGLFGNKEFKLVGTLMHIKANGKAVPIKTVEKMVETNGAGESNKGWTIDFGNVKGLKVGEKYVVYEQATSVENLIDIDEDGTADTPQSAKHENPNAESQTFVIEIKDTDGTLRTTVSANDKKANETKPVEVTIGETEQGVHVVDTIAYEGLVPGEVYKVETTLMHVPAVGEIQPVSGTSILVNECTADATGKGTWTIDFGIVKGLQAGQRYVVYEVATSKTKLVNKSLAESLSDILDSDLAKDKVNNGDVPAVLIETLNEVLEASKNASDSELKKALNNKLADFNHTLDEILDVILADYKGELDDIYKKPHKVEHKDPRDASQTVVVDKAQDGSRGVIRTTVQANGISGSDKKEATIVTDSKKLVVSVVDTVYYTGLVPKETYNLEGTLVKVTKNEITVVTQASIQVVASSSGSGTWLMDFGAISGMQPGDKYVVYEKATSEYNLIDTDEDGVPDAKDYCEHINPSDRAQTIVIEEPVVPDVPEKPEPEDNSLGGSLRTTIVADGVEGSSSSAAVITDKDAIDVGISIRDIVYYEDLVPGETYVLEGTLMHIKKDGTAEPVAGAYKRQYEVTSSTGSGQWEVNFGVVKGLQIGEKYVVYEKATSVDLLEDTDNDKKPDTKHVITHENPNDKAQTLLLKNPEPEKPEKPEKPKEDKPTTPSTSNNKKKGSLRTTVVAANQTGTKDKAVWVPSRYEKTDANIKDIVYYTNLIPNAKYELEATLMHIRSDGSITPVRGATVRKIVVADRSGNGVWEVDFGVVKDLVKEEKYVVYEKATSVNYVIDTDRDDLYDSKHIVIHQDPNDTAQTIFVKSEKAVGFYLKGQLMPMEEDLTLMGNPQDENKKDPHLTLFGQTQPGFGYVEDKNLNHPTNKRLPQTGSILSNTALLAIGAMITLAGGVLLVPRRKQNK